MRKRITVGMALAIVVLLALAGVALAARLNLFEYFGRNDARLKEIAPEATLATESPEAVESGSLGTTVATIRSAYYDGQSLLVGYSIENGTRTERFDPTEKQVAQMAKLDALPVLETSQGEEGQPILNEFNAALKSGTPYGFSRYSVYPSDHTETDDGIDLPPTQEMQESTPEGEQYVLREYENPLPEAARNRESLCIRIRLYQSVDSLYFDGTDCYQLPDERQEAGAMTATVSRTNAPTHHFTGEGTYNGVKVRIEADVSAVHGDVTVTAETDVFTTLDEDSWYVLHVRDAQGNELRAFQVGADDLRTLHATLQGTGFLPDRLTISFPIKSEGKGATTTQAVPILLTPDK